MPTELVITAQWLIKALGVYAIIQIILLFWLWLVHDLPIKMIKKRIYEIPGELNEQMRGRGITRDEYDRQLAIQLKPLKEKLELKEYNRKIFLDRVYLISVIKFKS